MVQQTQQSRELALLRDSLGTIDQLLPSTYNCYKEICSPSSRKIKQLSEVRWERTPRVYFGEMNILQEDTAVV